MERRGRSWGRSVWVSRLPPWDAQEREEQARRVTQHLRFWAGVWLPGELQIWDSIREMEEPELVGAARDPHLPWRAVPGKIHASTTTKRSVA